MKIKFQWRALQLSLIFHGIILLALINLNMSPVRPQNVLLIDFSMENEPFLREGSSAATVSLPIKLQKKQKNSRALETSQNQQNEARNPTFVPESSDTQDVLQNEPQTPGMTVSENNLDTKIGLTEFSHYDAQGIIREAGFHTIGPSDPANRGAGDVISSEKIRYFKVHFSYIKDLIYKQIIYPATAKKMGWEGRVIVSFIISSEGYTRNIMISKSSGHEILDENAVKAVKRASPFPKPPVEAQIIIPVLYQLN